MFWASEQKQAIELFWTATYLNINRVSICCERLHGIKDGSIAFETNKKIEIKPLKVYHIYIYQWHYDVGITRNWLWTYKHVLVSYTLYAPNNHFLVVVRVCVSGQSQGRDVGIEK